MAFKLLPLFKHVLLLLWLLLSMGGRNPQKKRSCSIPQKYSRFCTYCSLFLFAYCVFCEIGIYFILILHMDKCNSDRKESACNSRDPGSVPGLGRSPGEGNGYLFHCSCQENSTDGGSWQARIIRDPSPWGCKELDMTEKLTLSQ